MMEVKFNKPKYRTRCFAFLFDLMTMAISFCLLFLLSLTIMNNVPYYKNANETIDNIQLNSHLYVRDNNRVRLICDYYVVEEDDDYRRYSLLMDEALTSFFSDSNFFPDGDGMNIYNNLKISEGETSSDLFIYADETHTTIVIRGDVDYKDVYSWYNECVMNVALPYITSLTEYIEASKVVALTYYFIILLIPLFLSVFIFEYLIPIIISRGKKTLGKLIFKLSVVDASGLSCKVGRYTIRFLLFFFVEILLSIIAFLIPIFVSFSMFAFSKLNQSLHDYVSATYVVEAPLKSVCKTKEEYLKKHEEDEKFVLNKDKIVL
ncbi:MAG: RDD family protein [Bacilli bacterium]